MREAFAVSVPTKNHNLFRNTQGGCRDYAANKEIVLAQFFAGEYPISETTLQSYGLRRKLLLGNN
jgi:hypothetical protein